MDNYKSASIIVAALATCRLLELKDHNYYPGRMAASGYVTKRFFRLARYVVAMQGGVLPKIDATLVIEPAWQFFLLR